MTKINVKNQIEIEKLAYMEHIEKKNENYKIAKIEDKKQLDLDQAAYNQAETDEQRLEAFFNAASNINL